MNNLDIAVERLIAAVLDTQEYRVYSAQCEKVKQYPELKTQIDEFRKKNYQMQTSRDTAFEKIEQFEREYADFREDPLVSDFLAAELAFCRMMQDVNIRVTAALHFE